MADRCEGTCRDGTQCPYEATKGPHCYFHNKVALGHISMDKKAAAPDTRRDEEPYVRLRREWGLDSL